MKLLFIFLCLITISIFTPITYSQQNTVIVPDLSGLNSPQAASLLNSLGLQLGDEQITIWSQASGVPPNIISAQSVPPNTPVEFGATIDIGILRAPNMTLTYDDNDLTMINLTTNIVDVSGLRFASSEGNSTSFPATRWSTSLRSQQCMQVWTIPRNGPKGLEECRLIQNFIAYTTPDEHFWTQTNGVQNFVILENGVERANCPAASNGSQNNPLQCGFYIDGANSANIVTPYLYFAYTTDAIVIINQSNDKWMPTDRTEIFNFNPGVGEGGVAFIFGDRVLFENVEMIIGDITQLAPGQCIMLTANHPDGMDTPPQPCNIIAQRDLSPQIAFWLAEFEIDSATDNQRRKCPKATQGVPTLCIIPQ